MILVSILVFYIMPTVVFCEVILHSTMHGYCQSFFTEQFTKIISYRNKGIKVCCPARGGGLVYDLLHHDYLPWKQAMQPQLLKQI